jgi:hypothetical protein
MSNALLTQKIQEAAQTLPDNQALEVLDFIYFLNTRQKIQEQHNLQQAQQTSMNHLWDNDSDEAWNHV